MARGSFEFRPRPARPHLAEIEPVAVTYHRFRARTRQPIPGGRLKPVDLLVGLRPPTSPAEAEVLLHQRRDEAHFSELVGDTVWGATGWMIVDLQGRIARD